MGTRSENDFLLSIVGDSNVPVLKTGAFPLAPRDVEAGGHGTASVTTRVVGIGTIAMEFVVLYRDGRQEINPLLIQALREMGLYPHAAFASGEVPRELVFCLGGILAYREANRYFGSGYDTIVADHQEWPVQPGAESLPSSMIREYFYEMLTPMRDGLVKLAEEGYRSMWVLGAPPPHRTNERIRELMARILGIPENEVELPDPFVRLKLWRLGTQALRAICDEAGARFIDTWRVGADETGFLRPEYENDGAHANEGYGAAMSRHVVDVVYQARMARGEPRP
jgi:hypothetical protein